MIAEKIGVTNKWTPSQTPVERVYSYGYDERERGDFITIIHETLKEQKNE